MQEKRKHDLSAPQQRLLTLMREIRFGRIESLTVRSGSPVFDRHPVIFREIKFGGESGTQRPIASADFALKAQVLELFDQLQRLGDGLVERLEIKNGLPFRMTVKETTGF